MVDFGLSFVKYAVFLFNFLFAAIGIAMIAVGPLVYNRMIDLNDVLDGTLSAFPILLIVAGVVVFVIAFLGCCGAIKENTCMLFTFSLILMAIVLFEVGVVAGAYSKKDQLDEIIDKGLDKTLKGINQNQGYNATWHLLQTELKCCGINKPADWIPVLGDKLPPSCCQKQIGDTTCVEKDASKTGCKQALRDYLRDNLLIVAGLGVGAALIQLFGIVFACCLYSAFRRK